MSRDCAIVLSLGNKSETPSQNKQTNKKTVDNRLKQYIGVKKEKVIVTFKTQFQNSSTDQMQRVIKIVSTAG